ncbi:RNA polymerase factor sigma-54 [Peribacillus tepidiphilus]|uniref:RNA polymerase factor sigma-54 n=1 Tax=Peribacillus tepidiphilus TaxID=2652445 RepID=UPI001291D8E4|nr:RNA polymerase factor sigma-54 [Peribacillus tepidiphilus]
MDFKAGLIQQQSLKLTMTQELSQAIALLQYSSQELVSFLESKALENPLISIDTPQNVDYSKKKKGVNVEKDAKYWIEQIGEYRGPSLEEHILSQVPADSPKSLYLLIKRLVQYFDENGYLRYTTEDLAEMLSVSMDEIQKAVHLIQSFDPAGVGAENLQECLYLQAVRDQKTPKYTNEILTTHFILFAEKKWKDLSKELSCSLKDIQAVFDYVQGLNPRPGAAFHVEKPTYIVPDVIVEWKDGQFMVNTAAGSDLKLSLNDSYYSKMKETNDPSVSKFLHDKWNEYQWIAKGIQQRKETILRVMTKIIEKQPESMVKGLSYLKPMTMKEIAEELEIHESTVSRAVKDKYVLAPFGTIEMRAFFTANLQSTEQEDVSSLAAKKEIEVLIKNENKKKPLSDQEISDLLKKEKGIIVSRRTVAKYRDQLSIPSSSKRKRYD